MTHLYTLYLLLEYTYHLVTSVGESICNHGGNDGDLCVYIRTVHTPRAVFTRKSIVFLGKVTISAYRFPATGYYRTARERRSRCGAPKWNGETANVSFYAVSGKHNSRNAAHNSSVDYLLCCYSTRALKEITLGPFCHNILCRKRIYRLEALPPSVQDRRISTLRMRRRRRRLVVSPRGRRECLKLIASTEKAIIENRGGYSFPEYTCFAEEPEYSSRV